MDTNLKRLIKKTLSLLITVFMVITSFVNPVSVKADETVQVSNFGELVAAVQNATSSNTIIEITKNIPMTGTIVIERNITIVGKDNNYTLYQKSRESGKPYDTMFVVNNGGNLTLGENLTLTGQTDACDTVEEGHDVKKANFDLDHFKVPGTATISGYLAFNKVMGMTNNFVKVKSDVDTAIDFGGQDISVQGNRIVSKKDSDLKVLEGYGNNFQFKDSTNYPIVVGEDGELTYEDQYIKANSTDLYKDSNGPGIYVFASSGLVAFSTSPPTPKWVIDGQEYTDQNLAEQARVEYNNSHWIVNGDEDNPYDNYDQALADSDLYYYVSSDPDTHYTERDEAEENCKCPTEDACAIYGNGNYDREMFSSGSIDAPKGFFVQVNDNSTATLDGAILKNFNTSTNKDTTPKYVAPVVAAGENARFDIKKGAISNNVVGYVIDNDVERSNKSADLIKKYVKGAAPNSPRKAGSDRRWRAAEIDDDTPGSGITGTAGAVIYIGGAQGEISGSSKISYNRGDTGGIMVSGEGTKVSITGEDVSINHNVGVQWGGGSFVEDGGFLLMTNGVMEENVAWFGGGAVFATENGIKWLLGDITAFADRKDGKFTLNGGTLRNNTAFTRGGAILADSDGVALIEGKIYGNKSRMLGGAIYVMGDRPEYTYTVYIEKGYVHDNKAVASGDTSAKAEDFGENVQENKDLSMILNKAVACGDGQQDFWFGDMTVNSDDMEDVKDREGVRTAGTGGGVWLCAHGNTNLNLSEDVFIVNHNYASGTVEQKENGQTTKVKDDGGSNKTGGNDIHKDPKANGNVFFTGINENSLWFDENTGIRFTDTETATEGGYLGKGRLNLVNTSTKVPDKKGVEFYENISRRGGALAANGTFVFGKREDIAKFYAEMQIDKKWKNVEAEDVVIRVYVEDSNGRYFVEEVPLSAEAKESSELDYVFVDENYKSRFVIPTVVQDEDGNKIQVFDILVDGQPCDISDVDQLKQLAQDIRDNKKITLDTSRVKFVFVEGKYNADGEFEEIDNYNFISDNVVIDKVDKEIKTYEQQIDETTVEEIFTSFSSSIYLKNSVINGKKPEIEKYVNEAVHKDIVVDEEFTYDILAYITDDADAFEITDELIGCLEFVYESPEDVVIADLGTSNNHLPYNDADGGIENNNATVHNTGTILDHDANHISVVPDGKKLTVSMNDYDEDEKIRNDVEKLRGHWVKVTFKAQLSDEVKQAINEGGRVEEILSGNLETIIENNPVVSDEEHRGVPNEAEYKIIVKNEFKYTDSSNTVTVKPEEPELEKYVNKAVHKDIMLDEIFTYDIIGYISKDADKVVFMDSLEESGVLELVNVDDIKVESLNGNNHDPFNDIGGSTVHHHASVAQTGTPVPTGGLTISAEEKGTKLKVTIDDGVVLGLRGKYVRVTFQAQIKEDIQTKIKEGEMDLSELANKYFDVEVNDPVLSDEEHSGILNQAAYEIFVGTDSKYQLESNIVTVKPELPEIEKYVEKAVHKYIEVDDIFTYDIIAYITNNADRFTITDTLVDDLKFVSTKDDVKVYDLGTENNHKVVNDTAGNEVNDPEDTTVGKSDATEIKENINISIDGNSNTLKVSMDDDVTVKEGVINRVREDVKNLRGHWVKVTFQAQIDPEKQARIKAGEDAKSVLEYATIKAKDKEERDVPNVGNDPVESDQDHTGVINNANYTIGVFNNGDYDDDSLKDTSNTVTVKPKEYVDIPVIKVWDDEDDNDGIRPQTITVILLANDEEIETIEIGEEEEWSHTFEHLPKHDENDEEIEYTIEEEEIEGYSYSYDYNDGKLTNTHPKELIDISGVKTWDDEDDKAGLRPKSITVILYADEEEVDRVVVTEKEKWAYSFKNLPKYKDKAEIEYSVDEEVVPEGYDKFIFGYDITNQHVPEDEPKKLVNGKQEFSLTNRDEILTYSITVRVPSKTTELSIEDNLPEVLQLVSTEFSEKDIEVKVKGQSIKVEITDKDLLKELTGKVLTLTIKARINPSISDKELIENYGEGVVNIANISINNNPKKTKGASFTPEKKKDKPKYDIPKTGIDE